MRPSESLTQALRERGDLWEVASGLTGIRGETHARLRAIDNRIRQLCVAETTDEWTVPSALPLVALERSQYFASFPQWLSLASHLTDRDEELERVARSSAPARAAAGAAVAATCALPPAVCYHVYSAFADTTVGGRQLITAQGTCWRHEGSRHSALERGWAFTMREIICIGTEAECLAFRDRGIALATGLQRELGLRGDVLAAEDPFFAPTSRGRALLQRLKGLKQELRLSLGERHDVAAASFNLHERFFGEAFDIRLPDGSPAFSACVAFGLERWLLASLVAEAEIEPAVRAPGEESLV